jgi:hypothetical protein
VNVWVTAVEAVLQNKTVVLLLLTRKSDEISDSFRDVRFYFSAPEHKERPSVVCGEVLSRGFFTRRSHSLFHVRFAARITF